MSATANALASKQAHLRQVLVESLTDDDVRAVVRKLVELTKEGDLRAARLLLHYGLGKPQDAARADEPRALPANGNADLPPVSLDPLLAELIREEIHKGVGADNKRRETAPSKPVSVPPGAAAETRRFVNLPGSTPARP
jgi:hypothetical protein